MIKNTNQKQKFIIGNTPDSTYRLANEHCPANKIHLIVTPVSAVEYLIHNKSDNRENITVDHRQRGVVMARVDKFTPLKLAGVFFTLGELLKNNGFSSEKKHDSAQSKIDYQLKNGKTDLVGASDICDIQLHSPRVAWHAIEIKYQDNQWETRFVADKKTKKLQNGNIIRIGPYQLELKANGKLTTQIATHDCLTLINLYVVHPKNKHQHLIHGCSLSIQAGNFMGIIGPSGAGKSTLLKAIRAIIPLKYGIITLSNQDTKKNP